MSVPVVIVCPHCGYDHAKELAERLEDWISDEPYDTECICGETFTVTTHVAYSFTASILPKEEPTDAN